MFGYLAIKVSGLVVVEIRGFAAVGFFGDFLTRTWLGELFPGLVLFFDGLQVGVVVVGVAGAVGFFDCWALPHLVGVFAAG